MTPHTLFFTTWEVQIGKLYYAGGTLENLKVWILYMFHYKCPFVLNAYFFSIQFGIAFRQEKRFLFSGNSFSRLLLLARNIKLAQTLYISVENLTDKFWIIQSEFRICLGHGMEPLGMGGAILFYLSQYNFNGLRSS